MVISRLIKFADELELTVSAINRMGSFAYLLNFMFIKYHLKVVIISSICHQHVVHHSQISYYELVD